MNVIPLNPEARRKAEILSLVRLAHRSHDRQNYARALIRLDEALSHANKLRPGGSKAIIVAKIFALRNRINAKVQRNQAFARNYIPSGMDLMKDYGEGRLVRRPSASEPQL